LELGGGGGRSKSLVWGSCRYGVAKDFESSAHAATTRLMTPLRLFCLARDGYEMCGERYEVLGERLGLYIDAF